MMKKILCLILILVCCPAFADEPGDSGKIRLGVMKFLSKAEGVTDKQAEAIGDVFSRLLANSEAILVVERERLDEVIDELQKQHEAKQSQPGNESVTELGKIIGCRYMLTGAVTGLEKQTRTLDFWLVSETKQEVSATIDIRIIDVQTSEIVTSFSETGKTLRKAPGGDAWFYKVTKEFDGIEADAIREAVSRSAFRVREVLAGEYARVVRPSAKETAINAGENWGIAAGGLFCVYSEGEEIRNLDGTSMGRKLTPVAVLEIGNVQKDFSMARIYKKAGKASDIRKGYVVLPITESEADKLIKQKVFLSKKGSKGK